MNVSAPFIRRPVATWLLSFAVVLAGMLGFELMDRLVHAPRRAKSESL